MKTNILSMLFIALFSFCAMNVNAQLKVKNNGNVKIGSQSPWSSGGKLEITGINQTLEARIFPSSANIARLWTLNSRYGFGFGIDQNGYGHIYRNIHSPSSIMTFNSNGYFGIGRTPYYKLDVNGSIRVNYTIYSSDPRLKSNVNTLSNQADKLVKLNSVTYKLNNSTNKSQDTPQTETMNPEKVISEPEKQDNRIHYGFIAQEVREIYPELVYEDEEGMLGIDYVAFIPLLIEKIKDQNNAIASLEREIETIKRNENINSIEDINNSNSMGNLHQNFPNPFTEETRIKFDLSNSVNSAELYIYDLNGKQIKNYFLSDRESGVILIKGTELQAGMYLYSLVADGKLIDTKTMILTDK